MASIKDVAKEAGVGVATVSRVLNESGYVSADTKDKILKAMKKLNYTPNELARQLYRKKVGTVAVLMPDVAHPLFGELTRDIETFLYEKGYKTMICNTFKAENSEQEYLSMLDKQIVDGIITGVHSLQIEAYLNIDKPIVAFDRYLGKAIPVVGANHVEGGKTAAKLLVDSGCTKVLQFVGSKSVDAPTHDRHIEFEKYMKKNNIEVISIELEWNKHNSEYFESTTEKIMNQYPDVDGVFGTDMLTIYAMKTALKQNKKIPEELKIVSYDGSYITEAMTPSITSVVQPVRLIAQNLVDMICKMIDGEKCLETRIQLATTVRIGETTTCR